MVVDTPLPHVSDTDFISTSVITNNLVNCSHTAAAGRSVLTSARDNLSWTWRWSYWDVPGNWGWMVDILASRLSCDPYLQCCKQVSTYHWTTFGGHHGEKIPGQFISKVQQPEMFFVILGRMQTWSEKPTNVLGVTVGDVGGILAEPFGSLMGCVSTISGTKWLAQNLQLNPHPLPFGPSSPTTSWPLLSCPGAVQVIFGSTSLCLEETTGNPCLVDASWNSDDEGGKAKVCTIHPNVKTRNPVSIIHLWICKYSIYLLHMYRTHFKFQFSNSSCICTPNKQVTAINVFVQFSLGQPSPDFSQHPPVLQSFWFRIRDNSSLAIWLASFLLSCRVGVEH